MLKMTDFQQNQRSLTRNLVFHETYSLNSHATPFNNSLHCTTTKIGNFEVEKTIILDNIKPTPAASVCFGSRHNTERFKINITCNRSAMLKTIHGFFYFERINKI